MATDSELLRERMKEQFSRKLWRTGWKKQGNAFFKEQMTIEFDDLGFFFWVSDYRAAGMAWDTLNNWIKDGKIEFKNGVVLEI